MTRNILVYKLILLLSFVILAHVFLGGDTPGQSDPSLERKWRQFKAKYEVEEFGSDGYFVRAIRNGHNLFNKTYDFAWRFTRNNSDSLNNSCSSCHEPEEMAYAFVQSDRYVKQYDKRVSFEERIMRCYAKNLDGFVPTIYDPVIRDIRIYARIIAHRLNLVEGDLSPEPIL